jgi:hypothetical protein
VPKSCNTSCLPPDQDLQEPPAASYCHPQLLAKDWKNLPKGPEQLELLPNTSP